MKTRSHPPPLIAFNNEVQAQWVNQSKQSPPPTSSIVAEEVNALSTPVEHQSSLASHQQLPHDKPNLEVRTVSSPPIIPAASSRCSGRALHPSMQADGANKIGDYNPQHETKLAPKRKQTEVQRGAGGSKKKSRK
ncbi:hypothetical protein DFH29DRAFT_1002415 [Suillus ampliporus]|nr:hypothetical protein DFH29DRAFT_1002415 [Suillus ampliporus]